MHVNKAGCETYYGQVVMVKFVFNLISAYLKFSLKIQKKGNSSNLKEIQSISFF